jgi:hypothetical protein
LRKYFGKRLVRRFFYDFFGFFNGAHIRYPGSQKKNQSSLKTTKLTQKPLEI